MAKEDLTLVREETANIPHNQAKLIIAFLKECCHLLFRSLVVPLTFYMHERKYVKPFILNEPQIMAIKEVQWCNGIND